MASGLYSGVSGLALGSGLYRNVSGLWGGASGLVSGFGGSNPYGGASLYLDFLTMTAPTFDSRITFTRGSNATLTDSTGKVTYAPANLLTYSEQFDNAAWVKASIGVTANAAVAPDGTTTADKIYPTVTAGRIYQSPSTSGSSIFSFYAKAGEMTAVNIRAPNNGPAAIAYLDLNTGTVSGVNASYGSASATPVGNGWYRFVFVLTAALTNISFAPCDAAGSTASTPSGTNGIYAWGAQLEPVTYQTTPAAYVATTSSAYYGPRFDYDPVTLAAKGLLIEEARTNLLVQSNDFFTSWNTTNVTRTLNSTLSPDGTTNGVKLAATASAATAVYGQAAVASTSATFTVYVKQGTGATTANTIGLRNVTTLTNLVFITLNFTTGAVSYSVGSTGATATNVGNGWWRVQLTATSGITSGDTCAVYVGWSGAVATAGDFLYAYGAQLEAGAFATSYIPTVASTVTRSADVATMTGTNFSSWYNQSAGTFVVGADSLTTSSVGWLLTASDGTSNNRFGHYRSGVNLGGYVVTAAVTQMDLTLASVAANTAFKASVASTVNDGNAAFNGAIAAGDTSITMPTLNKLEIGANNGAVYNGHIRTVAYFNTRLADAQLQSLTT